MENTVKRHTRYKLDQMQEGYGLISRLPHADHFFSESLVEQSIIPPLIAECLSKLSWLSGPAL